MVRKNILPRHSRRVALHDDMVFVLPTTLVRYQFRNAHAKDISCEVFVSGANLHSHVVAHLQSWLQGGLSLLLPRGSLRGESKRHVMLFVTLLLCQMFMFCSFFGVASRILGSALAPSKDVHCGRVYSHVGGCEVASLDFFVFFVVQCGVSFKHACVRDNTHFTIQS